MCTHILMYVLITVPIELQRAIQNALIMKGGFDNFMKGTFSWVAVPSDWY